MQNTSSTLACRRTIPRRCLGSLLHPTSRQVLRESSLDERLALLEELAPELSRIFYAHGFDRSRDFWVRHGEVVTPVDIWKRIVAKDAYWAQKSKPLSAFAEACRKQCLDGDRRARRRKAVDLDESNDEALDAGTVSQPDTVDAKRDIDRLEHALGQLPEPARKVAMLDLRELDHSSAANEVHPEWLARDEAMLSSLRAQLVAALLRRNGSLELADRLIEVANDKLDALRADAMRKERERVREKLHALLETA